MGSEILIPVVIGLKWGSFVFACLGLIYITLFRFRNSSVVCRLALRSILFVFGATLLALSAICAPLVLGWFFVVLTAKINPPSDRYMILCVAIVVGAVVAGAWWGLIALFRHFDRSLESQAKA